MRARFLTNLSMTLGASIALGQLFGEGDVQSRISALELEMQMVRTETANGNFGARTASANPQVDSYGWYTTADFLWWNLYEGGTDYVYTDRETPGATPFKGKLKHLDFDWNPGFRVGIGYQLDEHDGWDGYLNFTWYQTDASNSKSAHGDHALITADGLVSSLTLNKAHAHWNVAFYNLYLELGRNFFVSKFLSVRPAFGLVTTWFNQNRRIRYVADSPYLKLNIHGHNDFWGIGPRAGFTGEWFLGEHFGLFGSATGALLWGTFDVHEEENSSAAGKIYDLNFDTHHFSPMLGFQLGIAYDVNFHNNQNHFGVKVAYENQYWWRQNQFPNFSGSPSLYWEHDSEDLSMQGLTVDFRFDF
ncbi:MAG: MOMP family protein [Parachlamydiales bacterium]|nr:MOMP family protein [Candidatus Acheromyda pituitae]